MDRRVGHGVDAGDDHKHACGRRLPTGRPSTGRSRGSPTWPRLWLLPVAAETYDGYLNDINGGHVTEQVGRAALDARAPGPVSGSAGGGTGMNCYGYKGGNGSASRVIEAPGGPYTVGVFLQCNFGSRHELRIAGVPWARRWPTTTRWCDGPARAAAPAR